MAGVPQHDVAEVVHSRFQSRDMLEQAFDDGIICFQMRILLVLFLVESKYVLPHFGHLDQVVNNPSATVISSNGHQIVSLCRFVCEEEKNQLMSFLMNSEYLFRWFGFVVFIFVYNISLH